MIRTPLCVLPAVLGLVLGTTYLSAQSSASDRALFERETDLLRRQQPQQYQQVREGFTLLTEMLLGRLGYDVGPFDGVLDNRTKSGIREYQKAHNIPDTGDPFNFDTVQAVRLDDQLLNSSPLSLQPKRVFVEQWTRGFVSADGTWTVTGEDLPSPEQTSNISCDRAQAVCREATARVSRNGSSRLLSVDVYTYEIERWNDEEIVTKPLQFGCSGTLHRWSRSEKSVTGVRSMTSNEGSCRAFERQEVQLVLEDGNAVAERLAARQRDAWRQIVRVSPVTLRKLTGPAE
jgi:putative peptidoglycan binding protein